MSSSSQYSPSFVANSTSGKRPVILNEPHPPLPRFDSFRVGASMTDSILHPSHGTTRSDAVPGFVVRDRILARSESVRKVPYSRAYNQLHPRAKVAQLSPLIIKGNDIDLSDSNDEIDYSNEPSSDAEFLSSDSSDDEDAEGSDMDLEDEDSEDDDSSVTLGSDDSDSESDSDMSFSDISSTSSSRSNVEEFLAEVAPYPTKPNSDAMYTSFDDDRLSPPPAKRSRHQRVYLRTRSPGEIEDDLQGSSTGDSNALGLRDHAFVTANKSGQRDVYIDEEDNVLAEATLDYVNGTAVEFLRPVAGVVARRTTARAASV